MHTPDFDWDSIPIEDCELAGDEARDFAQSLARRLDESGTANAQLDKLKDITEEMLQRRFNYR